FGATLIGEAVDYPSYAFIQAARGERLDATLARIGPTLRLAVLTTVFGASAMALSSFQGLAPPGLLGRARVGAAGAGNPLGTACAYAVRMDRPEGLCPPVRRAARRRCHASQSLGGGDTAGRCARRRGMGA